MALAIFDLDNTLIAGDSDHAWGEFLVEEQLVDPTVVAQANDRFLKQYQAGSLDIDEYLNFALSFLANKTPAQLAPLHNQFMSQKIAPMMLEKAQALIEKHRQQGDRLLVITATNRFVTEPIVKQLGIDDLIACEVEIKDGVYTGKPTGVPSFQHGKVTRLTQWLADEHESLAGAWFYSDSHNDLPLLSKVDNPVAVNPDSTLLDKAQQEGWAVLDLRDDQ
ncbi:HAD family hydrolase [Reinekea thalattae]|uniref:Histidinol-phosphatase n=1 Tax=Reinekea thalattae TaxID=2593301 RepID=A0A5C8ZC30_9GAMM|nr:HAD family hydrolase [Reinekea thalattae]TXR54849.1 HAD family hydrolase [Reinekea thalattae]